MTKTLFFCKKKKKKREFLRLLISQEILLTFGKDTKFALNSPFPVLSVRVYSILLQLAAQQNLAFGK